ncbi:MAG: hypothetical protein WDW38_005065 [Sanguina aurantia]
MFGCRVQARQQQHMERAVQDQRSSLHAATETDDLALQAASEAHLTRCQGQLQLFGSWVGSMQQVLRVARTQISVVPDLSFQVVRMQSVCSAVRMELQQQVATKVPHAGTSGEGPSHSTDANDSTLLPDGVPLLDAPTGGPLLESIRSSCVLTPQGIVQGLAQVAMETAARLSSVVDSAGDGAGGKLNGPPAANTPSPGQLLKQRQQAAGLRAEIALYARCKARLAVEREQLMGTELRLRLRAEDVSLGEVRNLHLSRLIVKLIKDNSAMMRAWGVDQPPAQDATSTRLLAGCSAVYETVGSCSGGIQREMEAFKVLPLSLLLPSSLSQSQQQHHPHPHHPQQQQQQLLSQHRHQARRQHPQQQQHQQQPTALLLYRRAAAAPPPAPSAADSKSARLHPHTGFPPMHQQTDMLGGGMLGSSSMAGLASRDMGRSGAGSTDTALHESVVVGSSGDLFGLLRVLGGMDPCAALRCPSFTLSDSILGFHRHNQALSLWLTSTRESLSALQHSNTARSRLGYDLERRVGAKRTADLATLLPRLQHIVRQSQENGRMAEEAIWVALSDWWDQPAAHLVPWITRNNMTATDFISTIEAIFCQLRSSSNNP